VLLANHRANTQEARAKPLNSPREGRLVRPEEFGAGRVWDLRADKADAVPAAWSMASVALELVFKAVCGLFWSTSRDAVPCRTNEQHTVIHQRWPEPLARLHSAAVFSRRSPNGGPVATWPQLAVGGVGGGAGRAVAEAVPPERTTGLCQRPTEGGSEKAVPGHKPERTEAPSPSPSFRRSLNGARAQAQRLCRPTQERFKLGRSGPWAQPGDLSANQPQRRGVRCPGLASIPLSGWAGGILRFPLR